MTRLCTFPGCTRKHFAKGLCSAHYKQKWNNQPLKPIKKLPPRIKGELYDSFLEKAKFNSIIEGECWMWTRSCSGTGHAHIKHKGKLCKFIRLLWEELYGKLKEGEIISQTCKNPECVSPYHLIKRTRK